MATKRHKWNPPKMCKNGCPAAVRPGLTVCSQCAPPKVIEILDYLASKGAERKGSAT